MLRLKVYNPMRSTDPAILYDTGKPTVRVTDDEVRINAKILDGRYAGEIERITLKGSFDSSGQGKIDAWTSKVGGEIHYEIRYSDPVLFSPKALQKTAAEGIKFIGNKYANAFDGDVGPDILRGNGGNDRLRGLDGNDKLLGGNGNDMMAGGNGRDILNGGNGTDGLNGGNGNDKLYGGSGRDLLIGGKGSDRAWGGDGVDVFRFVSETDSLPGARKRDKVMDFESGVDLIDLSAIDARSGSKRDDKFKFIGDADFSGKAGELRFENSMIAADTDGDGAADFELFLANGIDVLQNALIL